MIAGIINATARMSRARRIIGKEGFTALLLCMIMAAGTPVLAADPIESHSPVTTSRFLWTLLTGASALALTEDQVEQLHSLAAIYHLALHRTEQDIGRAQRALHRILEDETCELTVIEGKLKEMEALRTRIQLTGITTWRDARGLLTPVQRDRLRAMHSVPLMPDGRPLGHRIAGQQRIVTDSAPNTLHDSRFTMFSAGGSP